MTMPIRTPALALLLFLTSTAVDATASCPPDGWTSDQLKALKAAEFKLEDAAARQSLALGLLGCLWDPDPLLRDGIGFEALSNWLRADSLDTTTRLAAYEQLLPVLTPGAPDANGFAQPFAALTLSELARADRKSPYLSPEQRAALIEAGATYVESVRDYRGFDAREGWRHGVAHGADLLLQLAVNPALDKAQLDRIFAAVASQVAPPGEHFYVYGEPARLARPLLYGALRGLHSEAEWKLWFEKISSPGPMTTWRESIASNEGLARRHNIRAFLLSVYSEIRDSKDEHLAKMLPAVNAALVVVP
jgi:hypothetical protein